MRFKPTAGLADALQSARAIPKTLPARSSRTVFSHWRSSLILASAILLLVASPGTLHAQSTARTGPQQLAFAGLRAASNQGQINALQISAQGDLFLLLDQKDGVRLLKTDPAANAVLAQIQIGKAGDIGLAMALDPAGNVYITGTTSSGALASTSGAAFPTSSGTSVNSFVAKFDPSLNPIFVTFAGGASMAASSIAATADAAFLTGSIFGSSTTLPVTAAGIIQSPAYNSTQNGFVEKFSADGSQLLYATYLSGASGSTTPAAIAADASDNAYIAGTTTSPGYPTIAAIIPAAQPGATSGFLTKLTPAGDGITFSTYIPGAGITSLALDPIANNLLLSGSIALGQFPVATVSAPLTATQYQVLARMSLNGSTVLTSTLLAAGTQSFVAPGPSSTTWVVGSLSLPLLPLTPLSTIGNSFAVRVNAAGVVDQTARFGGIATSNISYASAPVDLTSVAVDASGSLVAAGSFAPSASQSLLATETFDLPLTSAPTTAFPSTVRAAVLPSSACNGSLCAGSGAYLARLTIPANAGTASASLALSIDDSPNLTLRNLGSAPASGLQIAITGFTFATNCTATLPAGGECSIALTGNGPGSITVSAANAPTQTAALPAVGAATPPLPVVFYPRQLDFGIVSSTSAAVTQIVTVTNLTQQSQTFTSALDIGAHVTLPYSFTETLSDCTPAGPSLKMLAPGGVCHITVGLTASNSATNDGPIHQAWKIGARDVQMTAYAQAAALSLSAGEIDFGTQFTGGLRLPRYLYLSNNSTSTVQHAAVTLPAASAFSVTDRCPGQLEPLTVCQLRLAYQAAHTPASDSVTLSLDQGLTALVTGTTLPQPGGNGASTNPTLSVSATSLTFANDVPVTGTSSSTQTLTIQNTGQSLFTLSRVLTGDFTDTTDCGQNLAAGASCKVVFTFAPSQPGTRQGLLEVTAGAGTTPTQITLSGTGTPILLPASNGTLDFGGVIAGQPSIQWYKITQPFTTFAATSASTTLGTPYTVILVEDIGYGHGQPTSTAFITSASGTCINCWLGVRFAPASAGLELGTLTLTSSPTGNPYVLSLTSNGLPLTGLLMTPVSQDFGPVSIHSTSAAALFAITNLVTPGSLITIATPILTGDFAVLNTPIGGAPCGGPLAYTATCFVEIAFNPTASGPGTGTLTVQAGSTIATAALTGYGSPDPGISLNPAALVFNNIPGSASSVQTILLTNTSAVTEQITLPVASTTSSTASSFTASTNCGTLAPAQTCAIQVAFLAGTAPSAGVLAIPVTTSIGGATTYTVPLTGAYTTEDEGLEILAGDTLYGPQATGAPGVTRQFTIDNLTQKSLALSIALPRQFILNGPPCSGLAPQASCNFSVTFLPLDNGDITGTLFAQGTPTDGSATINGLGYVEGYGIGPGTLSITGGLLPGDILGFGQVPSGQSKQQILTLTNTSATAPLTIRRITSEWPFLATTTCGYSLAPTANCTVTLAYTPLNQIAAGFTSPPSIADEGTLVIESDAGSSPDFIDLTGSSTPAVSASPSNAAPLAAFVASQSSLTFATTAVGTMSAPQAITLDNTGTSSLAILGVQTTPDFTTASNCSIIIPGASCTLTVTFTPQNSTQQGAGSGMRIGAIEISSNASTSLEFISLVGVSSPSSLALAPASLNFGTVLVGASPALSVQLHNTSTSPATLTAITASGDYTAAPGTCPASGGSLAAGDSCALQITFSPTQSGARPGALSIASSATVFPLTVPLTGVGIQSHLQILPSSLNFGSIALGASTAQSLTLTNTGTAAITSMALAITGDYTVSAPCAFTTLAPGGSCSITLTFTPTANGARTSTLTVASSDPTSPSAIPLTGVGTTIQNGSFTLTTAGSNTASATVASGSSAAYNLSVTPLSGFAGTVILNCTPVAPVAYAYCSLLPSSVTLSSVAQTSVATLTTVTSIAAVTPAEPIKRSFGDTAFCLLFPALIFSWKSRTSRHRAWRVVGPIGWAIVSSIALLTSGGCGGSNITPTSLRYAATGTYQYVITASSTNSGVPITQMVTLNLTVQ